jgi:UPF0755 protein
MKIFLGIVSVLVLGVVLIVWTPLGEKVGFYPDYFGSGSEAVEVQIQDGESLTGIAETLEEKGVVKSAQGFIKKVTEVNEVISAGTYKLRKNMSVSAALDLIKDPSSKVGLAFTIPEAKTVSEIKEIIPAGLSGEKQQEFKSSLSNLLKNPKETVLPKEAGGSFEGWLFPATYSFPTDATAKDVLNTMIKKTIANFEALNVAEGKREDILKKASIVEAEVNKSEYYGKVARVIENRLKRGDDAKLGMDTEIAYGAGKKAIDLTVQDLSNADNLYNSRIHAGLPPTPICNPGLDGIKAVLNPPEGNWIYFVTVDLDTGETKFTSDYSQFEQYVKELRAWEAKQK